MILCSVLWDLLMQKVSSILSADGRRVFLWKVLCGEVLGV